jgi:DNA-3-methyladenine glycosylase II
MNLIEPLTAASIHQGIEELASRDQIFVHILETSGCPPNWQQERGFVGLVRIILGQQVSVTSANATYNRLLDIVLSMTPENILLCDQDKLKLAGLSRQKAKYIQELSSACTSGELDFFQLNQADDLTLRNTLKKIKGIGDWTVDMYLLVSLQRPDILPCGDLAIAVALQRLYCLDKRPTPTEVEKIAEKWQPWRSVATYLLWHYYLGGCIPLVSIDSKVSDPQLSE